MKVLYLHGWNSGVGGMKPTYHSLKLMSESGLPASALIEVGQDHRLADPEPLEALLRAVEERG